MSEQRPSKEQATTATNGINEMNSNNETRQAAPRPSSNPVCIHGKQAWERCDSCAIHGLRFGGFVPADQSSSNSLVDRLRAWYHNDDITTGNTVLLIGEAVGEIERLQQRVAELEGGLSVVTDSHKWLYAEKQRLEAALERAAQPPPVRLCNCPPSAADPTKPNCQGMDNANPDLCRAEEGQPPEPLLIPDFLRNQDNLKAERAAQPPPAAPADVPTFSFDGEGIYQMYGMTGQYVLTDAYRDVYAALQATKAERDRWWNAAQDRASQPPAATHTGYQCMAEGCPANHASKRGVCDTRPSEAIAVWLDAEGNFQWDYEINEDHPIDAAVVVAKRTNWVMTDEGWRLALTKPGSDL